MNLRERLNQAGFWDSALCLDCSTVVEPNSYDWPARAAECPQCSGDLVNARWFAEAIDKIERTEE